MYCGCILLKNVSIHAPVRVRHRIKDRRTTYWSFNSRTREGATYYYKKKLYEEGFNSRTREGATQIFAEQLIFDSCFNSRTREGATQLTILPPTINGFNSRTREGAT